MIVIWKGFGIVVPIVAVAGWAVSQIAVDASLGADYYEKHAWPKTIACMVIGCLLWSLGTWMNRPDDEESANLRPGAVPRQQEVHDFFFVPVQYWAFVMVAFGVLAAFT